MRYFGHLPEVELLRYEATIHVPKENKTLWYWEHQSSEDHWEKFVVPHALKPGKKLIAHHWGRFGMLGMEKRLERLRARAEALGCQFMASTTFREPVERDVSDEVFHRITGAGAGTYLGDEQLRFFLLNSQRENARFPPDMAAREDVARDALATAERILRKNFDLVATIEDLELQKNAFLAFFDVESSFDGEDAAGLESKTKAAPGEKEGSETKGQETGFAAGFAAAIESAAELGTAEQRIERRREERRAEAREARAKAAAAAAAVRSLPPRRGRRRRVRTRLPERPPPRRRLWRPWTAPRSPASRWGTCTRLTTPSSASTTRRCSGCAKSLPGQTRWTRRCTRPRASWPPRTARCAFPTACTARSSTCARRRRRRRRRGEQMMYIVRVIHLFL